METETMGRVTITARFEKIGHHAMVERGLLPADQIPFLEVSNALVDPTVLTVSMPTSFVRQLDLMPPRASAERTTPGPKSHQVYSTVRLIGRIPLQLLDFVIDASGRRLVGNPAHGGEQMIEMYQMSVQGGMENDQENCGQA